MSATNTGGEDTIERLSARASLGVANVACDCGEDDEEIVEVLVDRHWDSIMRATVVPASQSFRELWGRD